MSQNKHSNNPNRYNEYDFYFNEPHASLNVDDYNFSAGDYSEEIDTDLETPTSITSSKVIEANHYMKIHQQSNPIEQHDVNLSNQNPTNPKIMQPQHNQRHTQPQCHYLPHHTTILASSQCHRNPADVHEIYRRQCKKNNTMMRPPPTLTQAQVMLSGSSAPPPAVLQPSVTDPNQHHHHRQQPPHSIVLRHLLSSPCEEQQMYGGNNNARNYSCCYCTELIPTQTLPSSKRYIKHCVAVDTPEPVIEYYEDDLIDEYSDMGGEYDDTTGDLYHPDHHRHTTTTKNNVVPSTTSPHHQYTHSSPQLQEQLRDLQRTVNNNSTLGGATGQGIRTVTQSSNGQGGTVNVKSTVRGGGGTVNPSPVINGNSGGDVDGCNMTSRIQNNGGNNIRHLFKTSREYAHTASTIVPIPVSGNGAGVGGNGANNVGVGGGNDGGTNTDHIPPLLRPHTTPGDVIQTSQVHYRLTPHTSHRQRHRTTVPTPRYYRRTNGLATSGAALYKPPSKLCLPVVCQPEYRAFTSSAAAQRKYRAIQLHTYNASCSRNNRTLPQQLQVHQLRAGESINEGNNPERVEYEQSPAQTTMPYYTTTDASYNVTEKHPKRKLKNKLLTLKNPKRDLSSIEELQKRSCDMDALLEHFETFFDMNGKKFDDEVSSSKENIKNDNKTSLPQSNHLKSVKCVPSSIRKTRIPTSLIKSKQEHLKKLSIKNHTKLKKCESSTSQQTIITEIRTKRKVSHDHPKSSNKTETVMTINENHNHVETSDITSKIDSRINKIDEANTDWLDKLLVDLMASGYINQEQHDKSKSMNRKMRHEIQKMLKTRCSVLVSPTGRTSSKRLNECSPPTTTTTVQQPINDGGGNTTCGGGVVEGNSGGADNETDNSSGGAPECTTNKNIQDVGVTSVICKNVTLPSLSLPLNNNTSLSNIDETKNNQSPNTSMEIPEKLLPTKTNLATNTDSIKYTSDQEEQIFTINTNQLNSNETKNIDFSMKIANETSPGEKTSKTSVSQLGMPSRSVHNHNHPPEVDRRVALELHRSKSYIINLIDRALSKELGTAPEPCLSMKTPCTTSSQQHRVLLNTNDVSGSRICGKYNSQPMKNVSHVTSTEICSEITTELSAENYLVKNNDGNLQEKPSLSSFSVTAEEPPYLKQLKQLRRGHLKHIQEEIQCLEDLERFLDSCTTSSPIFFQTPPTNTKK